LHGFRSGRTQRPEISPHLHRFRRDRARKPRISPHLHGFRRDRTWKPRLSRTCTVSFLTDSKTSIFPSLSRFLSRLDMETLDFPLLHGWFLDRLGNLRFSCTCTIILSRPTWEPLIFPHLRGFLSRQNTGKSNFPRSHRFSRVRGWKPRISHTCTVPIADGHGSPKFLALSLGGSRRGRTWKPEVSHTYAWVAFVAVEHQVSHACDFGRFPLRPDMETTGFPWLRFWAGSVAAGHGNPQVSHACAWAVSVAAGHGNPPRMGGFALGRLGNPEFRHSYRGFPSRSYTETPNFVATTEVFHRGHTRKPLISSQLQRFSIAVVHGNSVLPTTPRRFPSPSDMETQCFLHLDDFSRWSGMETPSFPRLHFWALPAAAGHGDPKFPALALGRLSLPGRPWKPPKFPALALGRGHGSRKFPTMALFLDGRMETPISPHFAIRAASVARPGVETPSFPHSHMGSVRRPTGPRFPALGRLRSRPARKPRIPPHTWAADTPLVGPETPSFPPSHGGMETASFPRWHFGRTDGNPQFPTLRNSGGFRRPAGRGNPKFPTLAHGQRPSPGRTWKPSIPCTWAVSLSTGPETSNFPTRLGGEFALGRPGKLEFPHTLGRRIRSRSARKTPSFPTLTLGAGFHPRPEWRTRILAVSPLVETRKPRNPHTRAVSPLPGTPKSPHLGGFSARRDYNTKRQVPSPLAMIDEHPSTNLECGRRPRTTINACKKNKPSHKHHDQPSKSGDTLPHPNTDRARGMQQPITSKDSSVLADNDPTAGSPTVTLLRLLLPLNDKVQ
jgi:hypothetical protein